MRWMAWMSRRVVRVAVAVALALPLQSSSVLARTLQADELRQPQTRGGVAEERLRQDLGGDSTTTVPKGSVPGVFSLFAQNPGATLTRAQVAAAQRRVAETVRVDLSELRELGVVLQTGGRGEDTTHQFAPWIAQASPEVRAQVQEILTSAYPKADATAAERAGYRTAARDALRPIRLRATAAQMVPPTGGILAADESTGTAGKRLDSVGLENTPEHRQAMRQVLLTAEGLKESGIDAVILDRDTLTNTTPDGKLTLVDYLRSQGIIPGLKTDEGLEDDPAYAEEKGVKRHKDLELAKLPDLLARAQEAGMGFTKFRTTVRANDPPEENLRANARVQARQAKLAQGAGLVPIVEPEVIFDGSDGSPADHDLAAAQAATTRMLEATFTELAAADVDLAGMVLKTSMVLAGKNAPTQTDPESVGVETLKGLLKTVPAAVPAVVFLSGGQSDDQATANLAAVAEISQTRFAEVRNAAVTELRTEGKTARAQEVAALTEAPWELSYSFGRGLQAKALAAWGGQPENVAEAQRVMTANAREVQAARQGRGTAAGAQRFANAEVRIKTRAPSRELTHAGKQNTTSIAALISDPVKGFRGKGTASKSAADTLAKRTSDAIAADQGRRNTVYAFEGEVDVKLKDLVVEEASDAFHEAGAVVNPRGYGPEEPLVEDVVEGTSMTATNNNGVRWEALSVTESGGTSIRATGQGIKGLGITPELYVLEILTTVPADKRAEIQAKLDPLVADERNPYEGMKATLAMLAEANGLGIGDLHVVAMKRDRETARLAALERLQGEFPGLVVTAISDGTVAPGIVSTLGAKRGKHVVMWSTSKSAEAYYNTIVARIMQRSAGAVSAVRLASFESLSKGEDGKAPKDLSRWNRFSQDEQDKLRNARPSDAAQVLAGTRILTPDDVQGPVEASMSMITDNGWFGLRGVQQVRDGVQRVTTLRFSDPEGQGNGYAWVEVDDVAIADVEQVVARGTFALQEPAAADPAVVDQENTLLGLMQNKRSPKTIVVHDTVAEQTPGLFIAWERALKRLQEVRDLGTLDDAARESAVKLAVTVGDPAELPALVEAINQTTNGATQLNAEWFDTVSRSSPGSAAAAIGPSEWLDAQAIGAPVRVAFDGAAEGQVRSGAAALHAAAAAVAGDGTVPAEVAKRLDLQQLDELIVPQLAEIAADAEPAIRAYQETMAGVGVSG